MSPFTQTAWRKGTRSVKWDLGGPTQVVAASIADMDFEGPPAVLRALANRIEQGALGYTYRSEESTAALVAWYRDLHGIDLARTELLQLPMSPRAALAFLSRSLLGVGDLVVVATPTYPGLLRFASTAGARTILWPMKIDSGQRMLDLDGLEALVQEHEPSVLVLCNPVNPFGQVLDSGELTAAVRVVHRSPRFRLLLADEVHGDLVHPGIRHTSALRLDEGAVPVVVLSSVGKTFNLSGLLTSYLAVRPLATGEYLRRRLGDDGFYEGSLLGDEALLAAFPGARAWRDDLVAHLRNNTLALKARLDASGTGLQVVMPTASFLVCIDYSRCSSVSEPELRNLFETHGISVQYASRFGDTDGTYFRFNIATSTERLLVNAQYLLSVLKEPALKGS